MFRMLESPIFKVKLNRSFKKHSTCTKCSILPNGLHVNEILIYIFFQLSGALKKFSLLNYECYNHNISKF
jgi:hypothetical protein